MYEGTSFGFLITKFQRGALGVFLHQQAFLRCQRHVQKIQLNSDTIYQEIT